MWLCMMGRASSYHCASYSVVTAESCSSLIVDGVCHTADTTPQSRRARAADGSGDSVAAHNYLYV